MALNVRLLVWVVVGFAACGDDGGSANDAAVATDAAADGGTCSMGMADHPTFWETICDAANRCGWLADGHPELESDEASCDTRHAASQEPSTLHSYLTGFETRIHAAAACLGCQALVDAYYRPDLETLFCGHVARCGGDEAMCRTRYQMTGMDQGGDARFDHACPRYCLEQLAADAPCGMVTTCLSECQ